MHWCFSRHQTTYDVHIYIYKYIFQNFAGNAFNHFVYSSICTLVSHCKPPNTRRTDRSNVVPPIPLWQPMQFCSMVATVFLTCYHMNKICMCSHNTPSYDRARISRYFMAVKERFSASQRSTERCKQDNGLFM